MTTINIPDEHGQVSPKIRVIVFLEPRRISVGSRYLQVNSEGGDGWKVVLDLEDATWFDDWKDGKRWQAVARRAKRAWTLIEVDKP